MKSVKSISVSLVKLNTLKLIGTKTHERYPEKTGILRTNEANLNIICPATFPGIAANGKDKDDRSH